jgi:hypothetical protein
VQYGVVIVLSTVTTTNDTATWTAGAIYYNGEVYQVAAGTLTKTSGIFLYSINDSITNEQFDDGNSYPWIEVRTVTITSGTSGTGIADYGASTVKPLIPAPIATSDRQMDNSTTGSGYVPSSGSISQIGASLTTIAGINRNYKLEFTWSFNQITTQPEMYMGFYKNGTLLQEFHHVAINNNGQSQVATIHYMDLNSSPGAVYSVKIRNSGTSDQYNLQNYIFSIDGQA